MGRRSRVTGVVGHIRSCVSTLVEHCSSLVVSRDPVGKLRLVHQSLEGRVHEAVYTLVHDILFVAP
jgi:hypothetical protein